jgi:hypothetical protein
VELVSDVVPQRLELFDLLPQAARGAQHDDEERCFAWESGGRADAPRSGGTNGRPESSRAAAMHARTAPGGNSRRRPAPAVRPRSAWMKVVLCRRSDT